MKTITNRDIIIARLLQKMIDEVFGKGGLHHFEWTEKEPQGYTGRDTLANLEVKLKVCFSPTYSINLRTEFTLFKERVDVNDTSWFYIFHDELSAQLGLRHSHTKYSGQLLWGGDDRVFLEKLGFVKESVPST